MKDISLHLMDIVQNSLDADGDTILVSYSYRSTDNILCVEVEDNGVGMSPPKIELAKNTFYTTKKGDSFGKGIPLFRRAAENTGGEFAITSKLGVGTTLSAKFNMSSENMPPIGCTESTVFLLIICNPSVDFTFTLTRDERSFSLSTSSLRQQVGEDIPLSSPEIADWLRAYIAQEVSTIGF